MKCIYCESEIRQPNKEEIIPYALGGRYGGQEIICQKCNGHLGHEVDAMLVGWIPFVYARNLFCLEGHSSGDIPRFRVEDQEGRIYIAEPGWRLRPRDEPPRIITEMTTSRGMTRQFAITAPNEAEGWKQVRKMQRGWLRHLRKQGYEIRESDITTRVVERRYHIIRPPAFKPQAADFGTDGHYRAVAKIAFEYLATKLPREEILAREFHVIRRFILEGKLDTEDYRKLWLADYRDIYTVCQPEEHWFHRVSIYCNRETHNVIGLVELFDCLRVAVVLSWQYEGMTQGYCLIEYPLEKYRKEKKLECFNPILTEMITQIDQDQLANNKKDFQERLQRFAAELEDYHTQQHMREIFSEYFSEPLLLTIDDLNVLIPKLISYYAYRSNFAALKRLAEKDACYFLRSVLQVRAEKTNTVIEEISQVEGYIKLVQKMSYLQSLIELLVNRCSQIASLHS